MIDRFKKDYFYYLLGIIIPGAINFSAIPIFKNILGEGGYGQFNLYFTALLIMNTALVGWMGQSVIRLGMDAPDKGRFMGISLWVGLLIVLSASGLIAFGLALFHVSWSLIAIFLLALVTSSQQVIMFSISQAFFRPKLTMITEALRSSIFLGFGILLIKYTGVNDPVHKLLFVYFISAGISAIMMIYSNGLLQYLLKIPEWKVLKNVASQLFRYGLFLMIWFFVNYAIMFGDRYLIAWQYGNEATGNYSALFDLISRSIALLGTPILAAIFPIITKEHTMGNYGVIKDLIKKIILFELLALVVGLLSYFLFGFKLLTLLLNLPPEDNRFLLAGAFILCGSIAGQIGMVLHKNLELTKKTKQMLYLISLAFIVSVVLNSCLLLPYSILGTSFSFMCATTAYTLLVWRFNVSDRKLVENKPSIVIEK